MEINQGDKFGLWVVLSSSSSSSSSKGRFISCICSVCNDTIRKIRKDQLLKYSKFECCLKCYRDKLKNLSDSRPKDYVIKSHYFSTTKCRAKRKKIPFKITFDQMFELLETQGFKCALSGLSIYLDGTASLDRIDSGIGYTKNNIQWLHKDINISKNHFNENMYLEMCRIVVNYSKNKK